MLNMIRHDGPDNVTPLVIAHGLFGSARNWGVIAKRLSKVRPVIAVDMRNHGQSLHDPDHSYPALAEDLAEVIADLGEADLLGHSMGGKAAMVTALLHPQGLRRLIVADIAPVAYGHTQMQFIDAMEAVDLSQVSRRSDAETMLEDQGVEPALRSFFTQSLDVPNKAWRLNLAALRDQMPHILSFPEIEGQFDGPTLFLSGANSDYVSREYRDRIKAFFPEAVFAKIPGAGHWLHADKPREFEAAVAAFLAAGD